MANEERTEEKAPVSVAAEEEVRKLVIAERRKRTALRRAVRIVVQLAKQRVTEDFLCLAVSVPASVRAILESF